MAKGVLLDYEQRKSFENAIALLRGSYRVILQERLAIERLREGMPPPILPMVHIEPSPQSSRTTGSGGHRLYIGPLPEKTCEDRSANEKELDDHLLKTASGRRIGAARKALTLGACVNARDENGWTPLNHALKSKDRKMTRFLLNSGAAVNVVTNNGFSPLSFAIEWGDVRVVREILERGASPDLFRGAGRSPMFAAVRAGTEMVELLLDYGANIDGRLGGFMVYPQTAFLSATQRGDLAMMRLLLDRGADPHTTVLIPWLTTRTLEYDIQSGANAAMYAVESGKVEAVQFILETGVDLHHVTFQNVNAFRWAVEGGDVEMVQYLISLGAWHDEAVLEAKLRRDPELLHLLKDAAKEREVK